MECGRLFSVIDELNAAYCDIWETVCNMESPTAYKQGVDAVGDYFLHLAEGHGWQTEVLRCENAGNAICITINPDAKEAAVTFSGHIDTVHPVGLFGTPAVRRDKANLYGPGVEDCKGGVVACFMALDALDCCGFTRRPVKLIIQSDEETGSKTSGLKTVDFMCKKAEGSAAFLNTEGIQGNTAVLIRKGILRYRFTVKGKSVHSSRCPSGANAIAEAAHKILRLEKLKDTETITCNCGVIEGGTVANTVPDQCSFTADFRFGTAAECDEIRKIAEETASATYVAGCSCTLEQVSFRPAMPPTEKNYALLETINRIYVQNGLPKLEPCLSFGGSDAAYITQAEIPCVDSLGVEGGNIHSVDEYARLDSLAESAKRLAAVAYCL